jgi:hypothetical protein
MTADVEFTRDSSAAKAVSVMSNETNGLICVAADNADDADDSERSSARAICAQCGAGRSTGSDAPTIKMTTGETEAWVHADCLRFWKDDHPRSQIRKQEERK